MSKQQILREMPFVKRACHLAIYSDAVDIRVSRLSLEALDILTKTVMTKEGMTMRHLSLFTGDGSKVFAEDIPAVYESSTLGRALLSNYGSSQEHADATAYVVLATDFLEARFRRKRGSTKSYREDFPVHQEVVVYKMPASGLWKLLKRYKEVLYERRQRV